MRHQPLTWDIYCLTIERTRNGKIDPHAYQPFTRAVQLKIHSLGVQPTILDFYLMADH